MIDPTLCEEAVNLVSGDRQQQYGSPEENFRRIGLAWEAVTGRAYTAAEVGLMMTALKLVREAHKPQRDNRVDGIGYLLATDAVTCKSPPCPWPNHRADSGDDRRTTPRPPRPPGFLHSRGTAAFVNDTATATYPFAYPPPADIEI